MKKNKVIRGSAFAIALVMTVVSLFEFFEVKNTGATVIKNGNQAASSSSLQPVTYNGENTYVAKSSYYDYYSDTQVGTGATPLEITDAYIGGKNSFVKFNVRLMEVMKYNVASECPAQYPLYQGRQYEGLSDFGQIYQKDNDVVNANSNYWVGANHSQVGAYAMQGLVNNKLAYDSEGNSHMVQSNPANGKSGYVPYFNKKVLTGNKFAGSELTLGNVKENVSFPFRRELEDGVTYYEFDSAVDTVRFNSSNQLDYLGKNNQAEMVKDRLGVGGLFPENVAADSNSNKLNFGYGVKIEVPFNMTSDGKINGKDMIFEFSGDDDVWVFIDGMLALDMGGAHPKITGSINFATGKTVIQGVRNPVVSFATRSMRSYGTGLVNMPELGLVNVPAVYNNYTQSLSNELKRKLSDTSEVHTLTLFYMERGMDVSNMKMKFNLPEPTKLDVANKVDTSNVGATFTEETKKVAKKDAFKYDVVDKTKSTRAEIDMLDGESVTFLNEFAAKDILLVQESGLKSETRKLTDLYSTSWVLKDLETEIAKDNSLVVKDPRRTDKTMVFSNKNNDDVPIMNVTYTNKPLIGKFVLKCSVTDKYKEKNSDYKDKEFSYTVSYGNVFGGDSSEKVYSGEYIVENADGTQTKKEITDGVIKLKPEQKAIITSIPVLTNIKVKASVTEEFIIGKIKTTSKIKYNKETYTAEGKIDNIANVVEYVVGDKSEKEEDKEDLKENEIEDIIGEDIPTIKEPEKLENPTTPEDELDDTVQTGDSTDLRTWAILMAISLMLTAASGVSMVVSRSKK